jgi:hypothetical protein
MKPLTDKQRSRAQMGLEIVRSMIAHRDPHVAFQMRRYVWFRLMFDERGTPLERRKLKTKLFERQRGRCTLCRKPF